MRFRIALCLATVFLACFTVAAWSNPLPDRLIPATPYNASLSGRIASISDAAFSIEITKNQERKTIEFHVDGGTKVEGKLAVGSQATVEYRSIEGQYIAVRVVVTPTRG